MITFVAPMREKPESASAYGALMTHVQATTLAHESGVTHYAWAKDVDEPDTYVVIEVYRDPEAQAAHMATDWVRDSVLTSSGLIAGKPDIKQYATQDSEPVTTRIFKGE